MNDLHLQHKSCMAVSLSALAECYWTPGESIKKPIGAMAQCLDSVLPEATKDASAILAQVDEDCDWQALLLDHTRLMVGPFEPLAPPYGSIYLEDEKKRLLGESTMDVLAWYRSHGLDLAEDLREAPDFVALELEFVLSLVMREIEFLRGGDTAEARRLATTRLLFLETHLGSWIDDFSQRLQKNARTPFFVHLARLSRIIVDWAKREARSFTGPEGDLSC